MYLETNDYKSWSQEGPAEEGFKKQTEVVELPLSDGSAMMYIVSERKWKPQQDWEEQEKSQTKKCYVSAVNPLSDASTAAILKEMLGKNL